MEADYLRVLQFLINDHAEYVRMVNNENLRRAEEASQTGEEQPALKFKSVDFIEYLKTKYADRLDLP